MKRITFSKAISPNAISGVLCREGYPGWLVTASNLPEVEIVLARGSASIRGADPTVFRFATSTWYAYDRATGVILSIKHTFGTTREACHAKTLAYVGGMTPADYAARVEETLLYRITKLLKGDWHG